MTQRAYEPDRREAPDFATAEELVREALPAFGLDRAVELTSLKQRENFVFATRDGDRDLILRLHRRGYHSDPALAGEVRFVEVLRARGLPMPEFVRTVEGAPFQVVGRTHPAGRHQVDLQLAIDNSGDLGDPPAGDPEAVQPDPAELRELGEILARVHLATVDSGFSIEAPRANWDLEGLVGASPSWGDPLGVSELSDSQRVLIGRTLRVIREALLDYGHPPGKYGPIHADSSPANVLRTPRGLALIDFDDFGEGWHMFDLATSLYAFTPHSRYEEYRDALFSGYESVRPLDDADRSVFLPLLVARGLSYLGWAANRRGESAAEAQVHVKLPNLIRLMRLLVEQTGRAS